jgi:hypothetical protein
MEELEMAHHTANALVFICVLHIRRHAAYLPTHKETSSCLCPRRYYGEGARLAETVLAGEP